MQQFSNVASFSQKVNIIYNLIQLAIDCDDDLREIVEDADELVRFCSTFFVFRQIVISDSR